MEARGRTPVVQRHHRVHWFSGRLHEVLDDLMALQRAATPAEGPAPEQAAPGGRALLVFSRTGRVEIRRTPD